MADDLGYADLGVYGQKAFNTPHIDQLAHQGIRLTQAYANSCVCSATRIALITGRYQYRLRAGLEEPLPEGGEDLGLPPTLPTLPSMLRNRGYRTALFGKWHMGLLPKYGPLKSGYDHFFGNYSGVLDYFTHKSGVGDFEQGGLYEGESPVQKNGYYTDLIADKCIEYLRHLPGNKPFFISLHFTAPHWPWEGPQDKEVSDQIKSLFHAGGGSLITYGKMVEALDSAIGRVIATLDSMNLSDDTLIIFTSDNGGERFSNNWPFSGQKTELLEGGIRVPAIVRWPRMVPSGVISDQVCMSMDWLPTLMSAAKGITDEQYAPDGIDILPQLMGKSSSVSRKLYWRYNGYDQAALRIDDLKYLKINNNEFLFNVVNDPRERANLARSYPAKLKELRSDWQEWSKQMLPIPTDLRSHKLNSRMQADHYSTE
jgi:arylsulfatase A-like enzyme